MARSRSASFSDNDLEIVGSQAIASQMADMSLNSSPGKAPLQPIVPNNNHEVIDLSESPVAAATSKPVFGKPTKMDSLLYKKKKEQDKMFNMNRGRPEHHLPKQIVGPSAPKYADTKPPSLQTFSSLPPPPPSGTQRLYPLSTYSQPHSSYEDVEIYTDPTKANENLKALLEGGMEDDDEEKAPEGDLEDGVVEGIKVKLLPHQVEGVQWMKGRELGPVKRGKVPKGGILADDMGLGKTLQSISLIMSNPKPKHDEKGWKKHFDKVEKTTLVVAPLALIRQWEAEIKEKVTKDHRLNVYVHHGPQRTKRFQDLARYDVVITTYQILVSEHGHSDDSVKAGCFGLHWYRVILDEAHTIKNRNAKATKACYALNTEYRWCLTGTPMQNNLDELQSLVAFLRIQPYDNLASWREHIDLPMKRGKGHIAIRRLHSLLRCFMKRRTKAILKEEGALNPGGKKALEAAEKSGEKAAAAPAFKVTERKVVTVAAEFSPAERHFYKKLEERADKSLEKMIAGKKVNYANALVLLLRLRQACNHPRLVDSKVEKDQDALGAEAAPKKETPGDDLDGLTAALGGMNIQVKQCDICMSDLSKAEVSDGQDVCSGCLADRAAFDGDSPERKRSRKKKVKRVVQEKVKVEMKTRKPRNRRAIIDSDDEDDDSWLVPEDQQGSLHLGKAGGEEDENAEGGGESINSEDSIHHSEDEDGSRLDSFIVDDEEVKDERRDEGSDDSDDESFVSVSKIASQQKVASTGDDSESGSTEYDSFEDSGISESDVDSDDTGRFLYKRKQTVSASTHLQPSAKIRQVIKILHKEADEHKFIVFSQFTSMLDLMEPFLRKEGFRFTRYDGSMKNDAREASLHSLRNDKRTRILLCSLKCGSLGLNLTAATRVIILEPFWNPFVEEQAIDRVHRLTQTVDVTVYKLTVEKTVEERILELQDKKRQLAEQAIEGGMRKQGAMKLGLKEILNLFSHDGGADGSEGGAGRSYGDRFGDDRGVRDDVGGMLKSIKHMVKGTAKQRDHNDAFNRRW